MRIKHLILFLSLICFGLSSNAQITGDYQDEANLNVDSLYTEGDTVTTARRNTFTEIFNGKPGKAALYSLIVPGGGQIYNKKWWKLPLVYAIEGITIFFIIDNTRQVNTFNDCYQYLLENDNVSCLGVSNSNTVFEARQIAKKNRDYSWVFFLAGHLLTVFDAYVDRHLMEFDISEDLSFQPLDAGVPSGSTLALTLKLPISKKKAPKKLVWP